MESSDRSTDQKGLSARPVFGSRVEFPRGAQGWLGDAVVASGNRVEKVKPCLVGELAEVVGHGVVMTQLWRGITTGCSCDSEDQGEEYKPTNHPTRIQDG